MNKVLLSFDIEEFDMPFEYGKSISLEEQIAISLKGAHTIMKLLDRFGARATFFSTVVFAQHASRILEMIRAGGHEIASHGYYHSDFRQSHLSESRKALEALSGMPVKGFRMPRMMPVDDIALEEAGYSYNSSLNPVWLPGRYNHLDKPRTLFKTGKLWQLPASATPGLRVPLFWLAFHNMPLSAYQYASSITIRRDGYLNIYFHPWEFTDLSRPSLGMPWYVRRNSGDVMCQRFERLLTWMKSRNYGFSTIAEFLPT